MKSEVNQNKKQLIKTNSTVISEKQKLKMLGKSSDGLKSHNHRDHGRARNNTTLKQILENVEIIDQERFELSNDHLSLPQSPKMTRREILSPMSNRVNRKIKYINNKFKTTMYQSMDVSAQNLDQVSNRSKN